MRSIDSVIVGVPDCQEDEPCWDCTTMGNRICGPLFPPASESGCPDPSNTLADGSCGTFPLLPSTGGVVEPLLVTAAIAVAAGLLIRRLVLGTGDDDE